MANFANGMAVSRFNSTIPGGVTPVCGECGIALCFDISNEEYLENFKFWDNWKCEECNPDARGSYLRYRMNQAKDFEDSKRM